MHDEEFPHRLSPHTTISKATIVSTGAVSEFGYSAIEMTWNFDSFPDVGYARTLSVISQNDCAYHSELGSDPLIFLALR